MIIQEEIDIRIGNKEQIEHYSKLGYKPEWKKIITVKVKHLMTQSNVKLNVKCDVCGVEKILIYSKYTKNTKNLTSDYCCCNKCAMSKQEKTCLEKYGVDYPAKDKNIFKKTEQTKLEKYGDAYYTNREKYKITCLEKYGVDSTNKLEKVKDKIKEAMLKNYGVESYSQTKEFLERYKITCLKKYGVDHAMHYESTFKKYMKNSFKTYKYHHLNYQGSYEKYFLELMDEKGLLNDISNGKSYNYIFNDKKCVYYSDYLYNNITIEIKSSWTYDRNGLDSELGLKNEAKWKSVRDIGDNIITLKSKEEIKNYVDSL
jgi:hypothetical protein